MYPTEHLLIMLVVCFLRKTLIFTNTAPDAKKRIKESL